MPRSQRRRLSCLPLSFTVRRHRFGVTETLLNIDHFQKYCMASTMVAGRNSCGYRRLIQLEVANATLLFRYQRHRLVDPSGLDFNNDEAAIARAKVIAIGVSLDKPAVDPERRIAVLNESREEFFSVPVYSKPSMSST
jgi:hypothetical protein